MPRPAADLGANSSEQVYHKLRQQILDGNLKPGEALKERDLCDELDVSRTPVREALRRLFADGLAEMRPRRSIVVSTYSDEEVSEIFELGIVLESFVAGLAAQKATPADVAGLETILERMQGLFDTEGGNRTDEYARLDQKLHDAIAATARNPRIAQILRQAVSLRLLNNVMAHYADDDFSSSLAQHRQVVRAIATGDAEWAQTAMASHVRSGRAAGRRTANPSASS